MAEKQPALSEEKMKIKDVVQVIQTLKNGRATSSDELHGDVLKKNVDERRLQASSSIK